MSDQPLGDSVRESSEAEVREESMRSRDELQAAHDRLVAILLGEIPNPFDDDSGGDAARRPMSAATGVLCWALNHDHNSSFATVLENIDRYMKERGLGLRKATANPTIQMVRSAKAEDKSTALPSAETGANLQPKTKESE